MALYVVVHHQQDEKQPWRNAWLNDDFIEAIQTTKEIGALCSKAKAHQKRVYVHRCGWGECPAVICCTAMVDEVAAIDKTTVLVRFANALAVNEEPPRKPVKGQNYYVI